MEELIKLITDKDSNNCVSSDSFKCFTNDMIKKQDEMHNSEVMNLLMSKKLMICYHDGGKELDYKEEEGSQASYKDINSIQ